MKKVSFLPKYNNDAQDNPEVHSYRKNLLRINKWIATGSPADQIIEPWYSAIFAFYECPSISDPMNVVPMHEQPIYKHDTFGLKTLNWEFRLHIHVAPSALHADWMNNVVLFREYIEPYLD